MTRDCLGRKAWQLGGGAATRHHIYVYVYIYIYIYTHIHVYIYIYIHTHTYTYMYTYKHTYIYIYIYGTPPMDLPFSCVSEPHHTKIVDP